MTERRSLFMLVVLVLAVVIPMAASADRNLAAGTPTPIAVNGPASPDAAKTPDPEAEEFRRELLSLADTLDKLHPFTLSCTQSSPKKPPTNPKVAQQLIKELTHEELELVRQSLVDAGYYKAFQDSIETMHTLALAMEEGSGEEKEGLGPSLNSFTVIPTPTPTGPGIEHAEHQRKNIEAGNILMKEGGSDAQTPGYPTDVGCPKTRFSAELRSALELTLGILKFAASLSDFGCKTIIVVCPIPGGTNAPSCVARAVVDALLQAAQAGINWLNYCNGGINSAEIEATFFNTQILHADLTEHDDNLKARADAIDRFLFDFRNLNLRVRIEANLASPEDDPISLFALPSNICISDDPQPGGFNVEVIGKPNDPMTDEKLNRCGLLEVVSDTVRSAIDMTSLAGQDVHNAEAEFQAAVAHFNNGEWKLAYARFRKAYREAVGPPQ